MKKIFLTLVIAGSTVVAFAQNTININAQESSCKWFAKKVTGAHEGYIKFEVGNVITNGKYITGGEFIINMTTLDATDLTGEYHDKLVGHLKSDDFFGTEKFPKATLKIKSATPIAGVKAGSDNYTIVADLTIKGITKEVKFPAMIVVNKNKVIANANVEIDRTLYDIRYGSKSFIADIGDKAIDDKFNIKVRITAGK